MNVATREMREQAASQLGARATLPGAPLQPEVSGVLLASGAARRQAEPAALTATEPAPSTGTRKAATTANAKDRVHLPILWTIAVTLLLLWGANAHLERYITPQRGLGYWLGITGGSLMLLLLLYSARKRANWLRWMGGIPAWFQIHMVLGIAGPVLVLFHANFRLGATNSNVALICMLLVAGSGVIGRYIYTRLHSNADGKLDSLQDLKSVAEKIRAQSTTITFLPPLLDAIDREEQRLVNAGAGPVGRFLNLFTGAVRAALARRRVRRMIRLAVEGAARHESEAIALHARRIGEVAHSYALRRLDAGRRAAEAQLYARLFSWWHVLHIPLFFMLLIAGIAHVIAVNIY